MTQEESIEKYLQEKSTRFIINDLAASTGLSVFDTRHGLDRLMTKYQCRLQVTDKGEIIYDFEGLERRGEKPWQETLKEWANWTWKALQYLFKIWVGLTLIVYFIVFFVILLIIIIAMLFSLDSDGDGAGDFLGEVFGGIGDAFISAFQWNTAVETVHWATDKKGYQYAEYDSVPSTTQKIQERHKKRLIEKGKKQNIPDIPAEKGFVTSIYDFIFGQPRVPIHALAFQQEIAAFLREKNGVITLSELQSLNGLGRHEAEKLFSDCLVRFEGKPEVAENGVLYGNFEDFTKKISQDQDQPVIYYWDEYEPEIKLTGNTTGRNIAIISLNIFNLFFALIGMAEGFNDIFEMPDAAWLIWFLGYVPFTFSTLVFTFPFLRSLTTILPRRRRHQNNIRRRVMKVIFRNMSQDLTLEQVVQQVNQTTKEEKLSIEIVEKHLKDLLHDLEGEMRVSEQGSTVYVFEKIRQDFYTAQNLRQHYGHRGETGEIVFDTQD